jgi:hypothetical protein
MDKQDPPKVLVETWLHLLTQNEDAELKEHGKNKLLSAFEDIQAVANFIKKHHLNKKPLNYLPIVN